MIVKVCFSLPFYGSKQLNCSIFENIMKLTVERFKSNLRGLIVDTFILERDQSGRGGRGGLSLVS